MNEADEEYRKRRKIEARDYEEPRVHPIRIVALGAPDEVFLIGESIHHFVDILETEFDGLSRPINLFPYNNPDHVRCLILHKYAANWQRHVHFAMGAGPIHALISRVRFKEYGKDIIMFFQQYLKKYGVRAKLFLFDDSPKFAQIKGCLKEYFIAHEQKGAQIEVYDILEKKQMEQMVVDLHESLWQILR